MVKKTLLVFIFLLMTGFLGFLTAKQERASFENLSSQEMYQKNISQRDFAIQKAIKAGNYKCCIKPPCTMCYMEANQWNNQKAGTCACDDLIAQGKDPCPQCERGLCSQEDSCSF